MPGVLSIDRHITGMGILATDAAEFGRTADTDERDPLGERLCGMASTLEIDPVESVRDLRERK